MKIKSLKAYQEQSIASGLGIFQEAARQLAALGPDAANEQLEMVRSQCGTVLLEAPTGSGKTLIAANILDLFSAEESVVWFWFAPFKGLTGQTISFLKEYCAGLRVRLLSTDRQVADTRTGDVFVTTWQTVAVRVADSRNARRDSESALGVDHLVEELRKAGYRIGVVVDEAHHSFNSQAQSQAATFYKDVLKPDYTVLVTATPDDDEITAWQKKTNLAQVHRITVSREDAVQAGLVKPDVKCISFVPDAASEGLVDLELTCLRAATALHEEQKVALAAAKISLTPLMLVQVDTEKGVDTVGRAKQHLINCGFSEDKIAVHTADEPDAGLLALAKDEQREVLIFKMAVALGFDAPRAFTLVSMRRAKDEDFGVQLLGRILRVHGRVQGRKVPAELNHGYLLLANPDAQKGLENAGQRINSLKTSMAKTAPTTAVVVSGGLAGVHMIDANGHVSVFPWNSPATAAGTTGGMAPGSVAPTVEGPDLFGLETQTTGGAATLPPPPASFINAITGKAGASPLHPPRKAYKLKDGVPRTFKSMVLPQDLEQMEADCAKYFMLDAQAIVASMVSTIQVQKRTLEVFTGQLTLDFEQAALSKEEIARRAQEFLWSNDTFDARELRQQLLSRLKQTLKNQGISDLAADDKVAHVLNSILLHRPGLLKEAQKRAIASHATLEDTDELPEVMEFDIAPTLSARNIYGIYPPNMNNWEREFAIQLDAAPASVVRWWHRNEVKKPWSVSLVLPEGGRFFPDFVIHIEQRKNDILLADPKFAWEQSKQHSKILTEHPTYGKALVLDKQGHFGWQSIVWDAKNQKPTLGGEWQWDRAAGW